MKTFNFKQYKALLRIYFSDFIFLQKNRNGLGKHKSVDGQESKSTGKTVLMGILVALGCVSLFFYLVFQIITLSEVAIAVGYADKMPYFIMGIVQIAILFTGIGAIFNFIYFSNDNMLLQSLPMSEITIFSAKFTMAYIMQLFMSVALSLPTLLTFGITAASHGIRFGVQFYVMTAFTPLVAPLIPLLVITLISIPIMYFLSFLHNRTLAKNILTGIMTIGFLAVYFIAVFSTMGINTEEIDMGSVAPTLKIIKGLSDFSIYNYNWAEGMLGNNIAQNVLLYLVYIFAAFFLILFISGLTYKKAVSFSLEEGSYKKVFKRKNEKEYKTGKTLSNLVKKDLKMFISEPTILLSSLISVVMVPVLIFLMNSSFFSGKTAEEESSVVSGLMSLGIMTYVIVLLMSSTNYLSLLGFSIEGKSFSLLKSLPIRAKDVTISKIIASNVFNLFIGVEFFVVYSIAIREKFSPLIALLNAILILALAVGISCYNLQNDLKKPTLVFENIQKLSKNNTRVLKPVFLSMGIGIVFMLAGIIFSVVFTDPFLAYMCYFIILAVTVCIFTPIVAYKLWKNVDDLYDKVEC